MYSGGAQYSPLLNTIFEGSATSSEFAPAPPPPLHSASHFAVNCFRFVSRTPGHERARWRLAVLQAKGALSGNFDRPAEILAGDLWLPSSRGVCFAFLGRVEYGSPSSPRPPLCVFCLQSYSCFTSRFGGAARGGQLSIQDYTRTTDQNLQG